MVWQTSRASKASVVAALPSDKSIVDMADSFFTKKVFLTLARPEPEPEPNP